MATAQNSVDVCNLSFDLLRHKDKVTSLTSPVSESETIAARWYDETRRAVLGAYPWNFARKRAVLSLNSTAPSFGYANAYNLPNDFVGLVFVGDNYNDDYEIDYAIENGQILLDNGDSVSLNICYVYDHSLVVKFDPLFVDLLVAELAIRFGNAIVGLNKGLAGVITWRKEIDAKARTKNGRDNPPKIRNRSMVLTKRRQAITGANVSDGTHLF